VQISFAIFFEELKVNGVKSMPVNATPFSNDRDYMPYVTSNAPNYFVVIAFGIILALFWLLPAYHQPDHRAIRDQIFFWRAARLMLPVTFFVVMGYFYGKPRRLQLLDFVTMFALVVWPFSLWAVREHLDPNYASVCVPMALSFICLYIISTLPSWVISNLFIGMGLTAFTLIGLRVIFFGIESTTYYTRDRWHLGFEHPLFSASAVGAIFLALYTHFRLNLSQRKLKCAMVALIILGGYILNRVDSKNFLLLIVTSGLFLIAISVKFLVPLSRIFAGIFGVIFPLSIATFIQAQPYRFIPQHIIHQTDSYTIRIRGFIESYHILETTHTALLGQRLSNYLSLAITDSIYTSILLHFGLIGLLSFILFMIIMGCCLAAVRLQDYWIKMGFCTYFGVFVFFAADAQGLSPSSLLAFLCLGLAYRAASQSQL
jgi:hypothetical protein